MITQQPGSIPDELLSQGDNFFVFHLLSQGDLVSLKRANAHFSDDLLAALLNEPLVGHGVFWSSAPGTDQHARPYPLSVRVLNFSKAHARRDPNYDGPPLTDIYAARMRESFAAAVEAAVQATSADHGDSAAAPAVDVERTYRAKAIEGLRQDSAFWREARSPEGIRWGTVMSRLSRHAPDVIPDKFGWARNVAREALETLLGVEGQDWWSARRADERVWITTKVRPESTQADNSAPSPVDQAPPDDKIPF